MDVVNSGAGGREDWDRVACCNVINGSDLVKLVCKESYDGAAGFGCVSRWMRKGAGLLPCSNYVEI